MEERIETERTDTTKLINNSATNKKEVWELAKEGIDLLLNNRIEDAEKIFRANTNNIQLAAGFSFLTFINALMSYEDDKLSMALTALRETERKCNNDIGWFKFVKNKVFGSDNRTQSLADSLEEQIILADVQVCLAILTFLQQEFSGYIKGGWVLRKAWKIYQHIYNEILELYIKEFGPNSTNGSDYPYIPKNFGSLETNFSPSTPSTSQNSSRKSPISNVHESASLWSVASLDNEVNADQSTPALTDELKALISEQENNLYGTNVPKETNKLLMNGLDKSENIENDKKSINGIEIARLMAAVSFGYGVFQLSASLLPPKMLKLSQFFGFGVDRRAGIESLMYARKSCDMRAPLATLALLWYHTIVRPFFALDGYNLQAGVEVALQLINENQESYSQSSLFLFFEGRIRRLESNITKALECYQTAVDNSNQREIKLLCLHEVGWCYLIKLDFVEGNTTFTLLKQRSRWSRSFYAYLALICAGACSMLTEYSDIIEMKRIVLNSLEKNVQLDLYLHKRVKMFPDSDVKMQQVNAVYWKLFVYELLYLWNALPSCTTDNLKIIIYDCEQSGNIDSMTGLAYLISGSCNSILNNTELSIVAYRKCLQKYATENSVLSTHVGAFAHYELGSILIKNKDTRAEGKTLLLKAQNDFKDYDFEHRLNVRIHALLRHMHQSN